MHHGCGQGSFCTQGESFTTKDRRCLASGVFRSRSTFLGKPRCENCVHSCESGAGRLGGQMGRLPLAVAQAGAKPICSASGNAVNSVWTGALGSPRTTGLVGFMSSRKERSESKASRAVLDGQPGAAVPTRKRMMFGFLTSPFFFS